MMPLPWSTNGQKRSLISENCEFWDALGAPLTLKRKYKKLTLNEIWGQFDPKT